MNKMDTLLDGLRHQQAHIEDEKAFADMVMERIEGVEDYIPRHYRGTTLKRGRLTQQKNSQVSSLKSQFAVRIAASVALVVLVGWFVMLRVQQPVGYADLTACSLCNMDKYRIDLSQIPADGTSRDRYRCYQAAKREQTFYHNELIKYNHENM